MTLKEILLQELETADDELMLQTIDWLRSHKRSASTEEGAAPVIPGRQNSETIVEFFRHSPLSEVAEELDLSRDRSPILDRITL